MKKYALSRRTVLRGMLGGSAVALSLPLMEAMLHDHGEALADGHELPRRFVSWFWGNGVYLPTFEPSQAGGSWSLSPALSPLAPVKDYVNVCTGLWNRSRNIITHHEGMCAFSGYSVQPFSGPKAFNTHMGGPTIDQLVANAVAEDTLVRAIHVGCDRKLSTADGGTTLAALSHQGPNAPEYPQHNPALVWQQLFGVSQTDDKPLRLSIVDAVKDDLSRLQARLGSVDKTILDKHLEGVLALEAKIASAPPACVPPEQPTETNPDVPNQDLTSVCDVMDDLITMAFRCDITRVATNLFLYGASHFHFHMLGQSSIEHHNGNSHSGGDNGGNYTEAVTYIMSRLAHLAVSLKNEIDPTGGNLLDSTIIYASSDCGPGWSHSMRRQPVVLVGHGRNALAYPGIHYSATPNTDPTSGSPPAAGNTADVLLTVLQGYDPNATQVGDMNDLGGNPGHNQPPGSVTPLEPIRGTG